MSAARLLDIEISSEELIENFLKQGVKVQLQGSNPHTRSDKEMHRHIQAMGSKFFENPLVLVKSYPSHAQWTLRALKEKHQIISDFKSKLERVNQSLMDDSAAVVDELLTNTVFNAPYDHAVDRRTENLVLPQGKKVDLAIGQSDSELFVMCSDPFGSLDISRYLKRILNCYTQGVGDSINYGEGGAGIGSFIIFEHSLSFMIGVKVHERTVIGCKFPKTLGTKKRKVSPKNLIIINEEA